MLESIRVYQDTAHSRERVRVGEIERDAPSVGLATPNSIGTPSGMLSPPFSPLDPPLEWLWPLIPGELVRREGVVRTGRGIIESMPPAVEIAVSLSNDDVLRALIWCGEEVGVVGSTGDGIAMGMAEGDITGEKALRCGVVARGIIDTRLEVRSSIPRAQMSPVHSQVWL